MDVTNSENINAALEQSANSINRLRELVENFRYVTELERKVIVANPHEPNDQSVKQRRTCPPCR